MKRYNYTITELLTVIAIIAILAGIAIPAVGYARRRARTTACISNQGQTMKTILNSMSDTNNRLYSGSSFPDDTLNTNGTVTSNAGWTVFLAEKGYIKSMEALRCPDIRSYTSDEKVISADSVKEAYGVVVASGNDGKFDFRGTRLFTTSDKTQVAPSVLGIGGCATSNGKEVAASINFASASGGRATGIHHNNMTNLFFYDGHAESFDKNNFDTNKYYPVQGTTNATTKAEKFASSAWLDAEK